MRFAILAATAVAPAAILAAVAAPAKSDSADAQLDPASDDFNVFFSVDHCMKRWNDELRCAEEAVRDMENHPDPAEVVQNVVADTAVNLAATRMLGELIQPQLDSLNTRMVPWWYPAEATRWAIGEAITVISFLKRTYKRIHAWHEKDKFKAMEMPPAVGLVNGLGSPDRIIVTDSRALALGGESQRHARALEGKRSDFEDKFLSILASNEGSLVELNIIPAMVASKECLRDLLKATASSTSAKSANRPSRVQLEKVRLRMQYNYDQLRKAIAALPGPADLADRFEGLRPDFQEVEKQVAALSGVNNGVTEKMAEYGFVIPNKADIEQIQSLVV